MKFVSVLVITALISQSSAINRRPKSVSLYATGMLNFDDELGIEIDIGGESFRLL